MEKAFADKAAAAEKVGKSTKDSITPEEKKAQREAKKAEKSSRKEEASRKLLAASGNLN